MVSKESRGGLWMAVCALTIILLGIAAVADLQISNTVIDYGSVFGTFFQTFGEAPLYLIFMLSGEIAIAYGLRKRINRLLSILLIGGGIGLSLWQLKQYLDEVESYLISVFDNARRGMAIGLANSDAASASMEPLVAIMICLTLFAVLTILTQRWLAHKSDDQIERLLLTAIFASLTAWFALEVNLALKDLWGRVRPYELSPTQSDFTPWWRINGPNGHKSFPSGHTMAATLAIVLCWFAEKKSRRNLWIVGVVYGMVVAVSRIVIGAHFLGDVVFSYALTAMIIYVMWNLHLHLVSASRCRC